MKFLALFAVFLLFVDLAVQVPSLLNCTDADVIPRYILNSCGEYTCDGTNVAGVGCSYTRCYPGTQMGYRNRTIQKYIPNAALDQFVLSQVCGCEYRDTCNFAIPVTTTFFNKEDPEIS